MYYTHNSKNYEILLRTLESYIRIEFERRQNSLILRPKFINRENKLKIIVFQNVRTAFINITIVINNFCSMYG